MIDNSINENTETSEKAFKMLHAAKWYAPVVGGIETAAIDITGAVVGKADVEILVCSEAKERKVEKTEDGITVYKAKTPLVKFSMPISRDYVKTFKKMAKNVDLIQIHAPFPLSDLALVLSRAKKAKVAVWWHSDVIKQRKLMLLYKPLMKKMLKRADKIFVAGKTVAEKSEHLGKYMSKVEVIPFGVSPESYAVPENTSYLTDKLNLKDNVKLLFVGRLVYYKGVEVLLEAMAKTSGSELFIVGDGELEEQLKAKCTELSIDNRVHFLGKIPEDELRAAFYDCDVLVLPSVSRSECFGLVQLEAMAYGKPVINTDLPTAVPDVSLDGETGITVKPGDASALAEALNKLVHDPELRKKYGEAAAIRCRECFSLEDMQRKLYNSYLEMLGK